MTDKNKTFHIYLQDNWLDYEIRELVRLFIDMDQVEVTIDADIDKDSPVAKPGLVCDYGADDGSGRSWLRLHDEIDEINILNATKLAMARALESVNADYLLIDAVKLTDIPIEQKSIIKGDSLSASIAAASIVAKVTRDRMLLELHEAYPMYDFKNNKGYGTDSHYRAIREFGIIKEHRKSFLKNIL